MAVRSILATSEHTFLRFSELTTEVIQWSKDEVSYMNIVLDTKGVVEGREGTEVLVWKWQWRDGKALGALWWLYHKESLADGDFQDGSLW